MEVPRMEEARKDETHMTSAVAFVEGGIQAACDDACSICLEEFCESDPSTLTNCRHEFHLQCILEWCQRSSNCPMCMQTISLKDATSQELLELVEQERKIRIAPRNATIFHHPTLGNFELAVGSNSAELEEQIIQHLAAAAMGRAHHTGRRESQRRRASSHARPRFLVFSTHHNGQPSGPAPAPAPAPTQEGGEAEPVATVSPSTPLTSGELSPHSPFLHPSPPGPISSPASGSTVANQQRFYSNNRSASLPSRNQDRAGPSELHSVSDSLKSRFNAVSTRYRESISKSTRGWKERLFSRSTSMSDLGSEVRREVDAGIASVSRMMERLETRENSRDNNTSVSSHIMTEQSNQHNTEIRRQYPFRAPASN